jgi:Sulfotransferase family
MGRKDYTSCKYVFVCGLHRSGTSLLARNIANLENCTGFKNTPLFVSDEGQNLQDVYPFESEYGGPGKFGFDPRAHLTENSDLLTSTNVARLRASWHSYWDTSKSIFVEKTPGNLLMTRFLQAAFPNSYFIVIRRHPIPVSMGTPKLGQATPTSLHRLFAHWLHCHDIFQQDKKHLRHVYELTYEEYIANPGRYHQEIAALTGTRAPEVATAEVKTDRSNKYFDQWHTLLTRSAFKNYYRYIAAKHEFGFAKYGYSLLKPLSLPKEALPKESETSVALGSFYCLGADACAFLLRVLSWPSPNTRRRIKAVLPESVARKITQMQGKAFVTKA